MIELEQLKIVNYCHPNCTELKNIVRLPKEEAFLLAKELAEENPDTTAFYRFADFDNYYKLRMEQDNYLYNMFQSLGGKPKEKHPLSFVLEGSDYLEQWFGGGASIKVLLKDIPFQVVSFTFGDSGAKYQRTGTVTMYTKEMMYSNIGEYKGTLEDYMVDIVAKYHYIEVQLWDDSYCIPIE